MGREAQPAGRRGRAAHGRRPIDRRTDRALLHQPRGLRAGRADPDAARGPGRARRSKPRVCTPPRMSNASTSACCARSPRRWPPTWTSGASSKWRSTMARDCSMRPTRACGWSRRAASCSCAAAHGFIHSETFTRRLAGDSASGRAARQQIVNLRRRAAPIRAGTFNREFGERTGLGAYLGAGLWRAGESLGVLEVMRQTGRRFNPAEEQLLVSLSNAVAVAVSNARARTRAGRAARGRRGQIRVAAPLGLRSDRLRCAGLRRRRRGHQRQRRGRADPRSQPGVDARHAARPTFILAPSRTADRCVVADRPCRSRCARANRCARWSSASRARIASSAGSKSTRCRCSAPTAR